MALDARMKRVLELRRPAGLTVAAATLVVTAALVMLPVNLGYYEFWYNADPQGEGQLFEWTKVTAYMTATTGVYWGQLWALLVGALFIRYTADVLRALLLAVPAALSIALVNLAVAWLLSDHSRQSMARRGDEALEAGLPVIPNLVDDPDFWGIAGAAVAAFALMAAAGVGLGALIGRLQGVLVVAAVTALIATPLGGFTAAAAGTPPPGPLVTALALVPPSASLPSIVRTAVGAEGSTFTVALLAGAAGWAIVLVTAGWLAQRRRRHSVPSSPVGEPGAGPADAAGGNQP
jgi:hypothetical protein